MAETKGILAVNAEQMRMVRVWDLPVRLFHWAVVVVVTIAVVTGEIGGNLMAYHEYAGFTLLALVIFRLLWGLFGSTYARFSHFVRGPKAILRYARNLGKPLPSYTLGHNPLGGLMVLLLLLVLLVQAGTGLFANDDIATEGPLMATVGKALSDRLTEIHEANANLLLLLIGLHAAAVMFYWMFKRENLIRPMLTGNKAMPLALADAVYFPSLWRAIVLAGVAAVAVYVLVTAF